MWLKVSSSPQEFLYYRDGVKFSFEGFRPEITADELNEKAILEDDGEDVELYLPADFVPTVGDVRISDFSNRRLHRIYIDDKAYIPIFGELWKV